MAELSGQRNSDGIKELESLGHEIITQEVLFFKESGHLPHYGIFHEDLQEP